MESFIISKANDNNLVNNICNESTYYFGIDDDYIKNLNVRKIQIENKLISYIDDEMKDKTLDYLCVWGMIVQMKKIKLINFFKEEKKEEKFFKCTLIILAYMLIFQCYTPLDY